MSEPLPNCPLCGARMRASLRLAALGWMYCPGAAESELRCRMPVVTAEQLRALAALRKPRRDQRKRDVRPWRIEVFRYQLAWVARTRWMVSESEMNPPYSLHVCAVGWGNTREDALRACIHDHRYAGTPWRRRKRTP